MRTFFFVCAISLLTGCAIITNNFPVMINGEIGNGSCENACMNQSINCENDCTGTLYYANKFDSDLSGNSYFEMISNAQ